MSTIKSSAENLTLNADGANNDVIIQSNGSTKVTVDGQNSRVGIGTVTPARTLHVNSADANVASFEGHQGEGLVISSGTNGQIDIIGYDDGASAYNPIVIRAGSSGIRVTSDGLCFGADTAAANALDDYEEGTFTPTCSNLNVSLTSAEGSYTKVGRLVTFSVKIDFQGTSDSSNFLMAGLPFTVGDHQNNRGAVSIGYVNESTSNRVLLWQGTDRIEMYTAAGANITYQTLSNKDLYLGGSYYV